MRIRSLILSAFFFSLAALAHAQTLMPFPAMFPGLVSACDFCMCAQGISPLEMGGSAVRYDARYTELSREYVNGTRVPNSTNTTETYFTNQMSFTYRVATGLSATLIVPYAHKSESSIDPEAGPSSISNSGTGDISLLGRYNLLADHKFGDIRILSVTAGVKFANGNTALAEGDEPADADLQLGTGTTDFMAGVGYLIGFDEWSIGANMLAGIRGFGSGANGHVYGINLNYDITARYRVYQDDATTSSAIQPAIFGALALRGEWRGYELQDGQRIGDSGGDVTYIAPGMQVFFTPTISFDATVWVPFIHALNGDQVAETVKVLAGLQYVF